MAYSVPYDEKWGHKSFSNHNCCKNDKVGNSSPDYYTVLLYGDSWFLEERLQPLFVDYIPTSPEDIELYWRRPKSVNFGPHLSYFKPIRVFNFSMGGLTFEQLNDQWNVISWNGLKPAQTIFHVGTVDLANMSINEYNDIEHKTHWFFHKIVETAMYFRREALEWAIDEDDIEFINSYKFTFSFLADWGMSFVPRIECMAADELRSARNTNNRFVRERES
ncbi:unnamed protein product [Meganyctiphanes norvegica]|uniref:Uncharacterized protein n=1 Tax=Meganyctiphanes norvegica TaxID=48144 RepID=A0AAV2S1G7_MEGNR